MFQIPDPPPIEPRIPIPVTPETANFCPVSLTDWLELCRKAGVPHVPAENIATIQAQDWLMFDTPGEHHDRLAQVQREIASKLKPEHMLRYDFCAPLETKVRLARGMPAFHQDMTEFILDDSRAFDILFEFPRESVPVYQRPWIQAQIQDSYPVEYRVFVRQGVIQGISNYYPQRPLRRNEDEIERARELTEALIDNVSPPFLWPNSPMNQWALTEHGQDGVHFTADFIVTAEGGMMLLEGGPPHEMGAHPCCFRDGEIEGVALEDRNKPEE